MKSEIKHAPDFLVSGPERAPAWLSQLRTERDTYQVLAGRVFPVSSRSTAEWNQIHAACLIRNLLKIR